MSSHDIDQSKWGEEVTKALHLVLEEIHQPPHGLHVEMEDADREKEIWKVNVSKFCTVITGEEIRQSQNKGTRELKAVLKNLIFEKLQWSTCEV
ncbi:MAG: hypothetical protein PHT78_03515 [Desulfitobacteriaceae bacterium]|nr:hypothetical protein [Desulfitobacteriaceae bacterium]MDD4752311.1 hypothetical protein [Desulfitobacteriaceae bacterium]